RNPESADAIVEAAEAVLREAGYAGFSIEAVARRARAGKPTIYRWWPSKAALLIEVYQRQKHVETPDTGNVEDDLAGIHRGQAGNAAQQRGFAATGGAEQGDEFALADLAVDVAEHRCAGIAFLQVLDADV
ncbi:TetR family transcriptional regulator, partial [Mesorhizobium sp. M00.F.Ca.ET.216.01.1.1]|uniref:TetR family transcriptional regulator n=1 Tax=Mesorhizobium sp. M00.F.Ca.ET.216.01.1.1 TaxID=2500528 RepID=UPI00247A8AB5